MFRVVPLIGLVLLLLASPAAALALTGRQKRFLRSEGKRSYTSKYACEAKTVAVLTGRVWIGGASLQKYHALFCARTNAV